MTAAQTHPPDPLHIRWLGRVDFHDAHILQKALVRSCARDYLLLLEHPPTYTVGIRSRLTHLRVPEPALGAPLIRTDRGGDVTFHGPGQLVGYPVITAPSKRGGGLTDTVAHVRRVEDVLIATLAELGLETGRLDRRPGVWVDPDGPRPRKIAAIGVRISRGRSMHGFGLNVDPDLSWFDKIVPCGLEGLGVTSLAAEGVNVPLRTVVDLVADHAGRRWSTTGRVDRADVVWRTSDADLSPFSRGEGPGEPVRPKRPMRADRPVSALATEALAGQDRAVDDPRVADRPVDDLDGDDLDGDDLDGDDLADGDLTGPSLIGADRPLEQPVQLGVKPRQRNDATANGSANRGGGGERGRRRLAQAGVDGGLAVTERKPPWMRVKLDTGPSYRRLANTMRSLDLVTVCEEAGCPNIFECWNDGTATFMINGDRCTRACGFCLVDTRHPAPPDPHEPERVAAAVEALDLRFAVITAVARDDLDDGGAAGFAATIDAVRQRSPQTQVEVLIPDCKGDATALGTIFAARPDVLNHNIETVARLQRAVRPSASYARSLAVLGRAKEAGLTTKSSIIVGLGENETEVIQTMADLAAVGTDIVTVGQYLRPTTNHAPIHRWWTPEEFERLRALGEDELGIGHVESSPLTRSSYHARQAAEAATAAT